MDMCNDPIVSVKLAADNSFTISPNPAKDNIKLQATGQNQTATLQISDALGKTIKQQKIHLDGTTIFSINIHNLPPGKYYATLLTDDTKQVAGFVKADL